MFCLERKELLLVLFMQLYIQGSVVAIDYQFLSCALNFLVEMLLILPYYRGFID
jgi:hypothetical protein